MTGRPEPDGLWPSGPTEHQYEQPPAAPAPGAGESPPADMMPLRYGLLAVAAVLVLVAVAVGVAVWTTPTTTATGTAAVRTSSPAVVTTTATSPRTSSVPSVVGNCVGSDARTPGWRATVPPGWSCQYVNGREIFIVDAKDDIIDVMASAFSPAAACSSNLLKGNVPVTALPDSTWGGKVSKTANFVDKPWKGQARCASSGTANYVMLGMAYGGTLEDVVAGEDALAGGWVWTL